MNFKDKITGERFAKMSPIAQQIATNMDHWARERGVELVFTATWSTAAEDKVLGRVSDTHRTGRAFDIRTRGLSEEFLKEFISYFTEMYQELYGAVINSKEKKLIVNKPHGTGPHLHVQIRRDYGTKK